MRAKAGLPKHWALQQQARHTVKRAVWSVLVCRVPTLLSEVLLLALLLCLLGFWWFAEQLFDSHTLGQVLGLVHIAAKLQG